MSTKTKKASVRGVRYTDAEKKAVVDFVAEYNAANGRGGQTKAAEKFGVSQLTVMAWLKGAGKPKKAPKAAKVAKAPKAPKAAKVAKAATGKAGVRYTAEQKKEVVDFVASYNVANGRGGQSSAAAKYGISPLTVMAWLKNSGISGGAKKGKAPKAAKAPAVAKAAAPSVSVGFDAKLSALSALSKEIAKTEADLASLIAKFNAAKAAL